LSNPKIAKKIMPPITNTIPQINSILSMFDEPETWKQPNNPDISPYQKTGKRYLANFARFSGYIRLSTLYGL